MAFRRRTTLWIAVCFVVASPILRGDPPAKPKVDVEFRWLAAKPVKGVTWEKGIETTCGPDLLYPHTKPTLTNADIAGADLVVVDFTRNGLGVMYMIDFRLTDKAREKLVKEAGNRSSAELAVFIDGSYRGAWYFQKAQADKFKPSAGFFYSKESAERIVAGIR